jgi:8-oxo-dGTP pyrophosphatase MutT (NUDIX family)
MAQLQTKVKAARKFTIAMDRSPPIGTPLNYTFFSPDEHIFQIAGLLHIDGGYLLARQRQKCEAVYKFPDTWSAVIGVIKQKELNAAGIATALQRETREELGIRNDVYPTQFLGLAIVNQSIMLTYLLELKKEESLHKTNNRDRKEISEVAHFPISKIRALIRYTPEVFRIPTVEMIQNHWILKAGLVLCDYRRILKEYELAANTK